MRVAFLRAARSRILLAIPAVVMGCGGGTEPGNGVAAILASPNPLSLPQLGIATLEVSLRDADGGVVDDAAHVTFQSLDPSIVTVNSAGAVGSVGPVGTTHIRVSSGTARLDVLVTVTLVQSMIIGNAKPIAIESDSSVAIDALVLDVFGYPVPGAQIEFSVEPASLFAMSPTGVLSAAAPDATGFGTVTARSGTLAVSVPVAVTSTGAHRRVMTEGSPGAVGRGIDGILFATGLGGPYFRIDPSDESVGTFFIAGGDMVDAAPGTTAATAWVVGAPNGSVSEVATATGEILASVGGFTGNPRSIALSDDRTRVYVGTDLGFLYLIDAASRTVTATYQLNEAIWSLAPDAAGDKLYAAQPTRVSEFDLSEERVTRLFRPGGSARDVALHGTATLLIASEGIGVSVASLASGEHVDHLLPCHPQAMALSPDGTRLAISCATWYVALVDYPSLALRALHPVGGTPRQLAFTSDGARVIATNANGWFDFFDFP